MTMPPNQAAANPAIAFWLQSVRPAAGSLSFGSYCDMKSRLSLLELKPAYFPGAADCFSSMQYKYCSPRRSMVFPSK